MTPHRSVLGWRAVKGLIRLDYDIMRGLLLKQTIMERNTRGKATYNGQAQGFWSLIQQPFHTTAPPYNEDVSSFLRK